MLDDMVEKENEDDINWYDNYCDFIVIFIVNF